MGTFPSKIISTFLGTVLLGTSSLMWADEIIDEALGVIPQACQDVRATYKDDKKAINQSCFEKRGARDQALADCDGFWNYCKTPCDQTPPVSGKIKAGGDEAWDNLCTAKQELEACRAQRSADLEAFQQEVNEICCPFWPCRPICSSIVGTWIVGRDHDCDSNANATLTANFHENLTWNLVGTLSGGTWSQQDCEVEAIDAYVNPPVVWSSMVGADGSLSGTYTNGGSINGCWTATRSSAPAAITIPPAGGNSLY